MIEESPTSYLTFSARIISTMNLHHNLVKGRATAESVSLVVLVLILLSLSSTAILASEFADSFDSRNPSTSRWQYDRSGECEIDTVSPADSDRGSVVRFQAGVGARCELVPRVYRGLLGDLLREPFKQDRWYGFKVFLAEPWMIHEKNEVIAQWHSTRDKFFGDTNGRGPPLAMRIIDGYFRISYGWDASIRSKQKHLAKYTLWYGPLVTGQWVDWLFHVKWSYGDDGVIQIWKDGVMIVDHAGPNTYNDIRGNYLKLGSYHPPIARTVLLDDVYIGGRDPRLIRNKPVEGN